VEFKNNSKYDNLPCLIILVVFTLQFGFAQAKIDEEPGQNSITTLDIAMSFGIHPQKLVGFHACR